MSYIVRGALQNLRSSLQSCNLMNCEGLAVIQNLKTYYSRIKSE